MGKGRRSRQRGRETPGIRVFPGHLMFGRWRNPKPAERDDCGSGGGGAGFKFGAEHTVAEGFIRPRETSQQVGCGSGTARNPRTWWGGRRGGRAGDRGPHTIPRMGKVGGPGAKIVGNSFRPWTPAQVGPEWPSKRNALGVATEARSGHRPRWEEAFHGAGRVSVEFSPHAGGTCQISLEPVDCPPVPGRGEVASDGHR